jgi:hypothetical protein
MYDSISAYTDPAGAQLYAGYVDGSWSDYDDVVRRFPGAVHVPIATSPDHLVGVVLDVENGDATPAQAPDWCMQRRQAGIDPTVYCNASTWPAVIQAFADRVMTPPHFWIARWGPDHTIPAGAIALQHTSTANYDISAVADHWPGIDPEDDMPWTAAQLEDIVYVATLKAIESQPGRDALAYADMWWLQHCIAGTVPPGANAAQAQLITQIHAGLVALSKP